MFCTVLPVTVIYLCFRIQPSVQFLPAGSSTKFEFLACRVYPFHPHRFRCGSVSVALLKASLHGRSFRRSAQPSRLAACLDLLIDPVQTLQSSQTVRAWTFL